jgi:hypothetical protein
MSEYIDSLRLKKDSPMKERVTERWGLGKAFDGEKEIKYDGFAH